MIFLYIPFIKEGADYYKSNISIPMNVKKIFSTLPIYIACILLLNNCSSLKEAVRARELLASCEYNLKEVNVKTIDFAPFITFDNSGKNINIETPSTEDILLLADNISKGDFNVTFDELKMDVIIEIDNPNQHNVILDSMVFDCFLDETFLMQIGHFEHSIIPAASAKETPMTFTVPTSVSLNNVINAEEIIVKGKVWLKIKLSEKVKVTLPVPVTLKKAIPREQINAYIYKEKERITEELIKKLKDQPEVDKIKKDIKKLLRF